MAYSSVGKVDLVTITFSTFPSPHLFGRFLFRQASYLASGFYLGLLMELSDFLMTLEIRVIIGIIVVIHLKPKIGEIGLTMRKIAFGAFQQKTEK